MREKTIKEIVEELSKGMRPKPVSAFAPVIKKEVETDKYSVDLTFEEVTSLAAKRMEAKLSKRIWGDIFKEFNIIATLVPKKSEGVKPDYIFFYQNNDAVERLLELSPFRYEKPIEIRKGKDSGFIEYEHFRVRCIQRNVISENLRGYRTWQILIEGCLYNQLTQEQKDCILMPMMCPYHVLGGRIVSVL